MNDIVMKQTEGGYPLFEMNVPTVLYSWGNPPNAVNIECNAKLQFYAYPNGDDLIGIWAEGVHIRIPLSDIAMLVAEADRTLKGFNYKKYKERGENDLYRKRHIRVENG